MLLVLFADSSTLGGRIHVMRFVRNKNNRLVGKILIGDGILFLGVKVRMKSLNCGKANINTLCISSLKIVNFLYIDTIPVYEYLLGKQVFR